MADILKQCMRWYRCDASYHGDLCMFFVVNVVVVHILDEKSTTPNRKICVRLYRIILNIHIFRQKMGRQRKRDSIYIKYRKPSTHHNRVIDIVLLLRWIKYSQFFQSNLIYFTIFFPWIWTVSLRYCKSPDLLRLSHWMGRKWT